MDTFEILGSQGPILKSLCPDIFTRYSTLLSTLVTLYNLQSRPESWTHLHPEKSVPWYIYCVRLL